MANIFVIDDDDQLLQMVGLMLKRGGHETTLINNPANGLEALQETDPLPDALIVDVMMPGMSGHDLCRRIRAVDRFADLPILVLTARTQDIDRETALRSGANDYMRKPVTSQALIERVDKLLGSREDSAPEPEDHKVISIFSLRGGSGKTTLAVNLAAALRTQSRADVCIVDLNPAGAQTNLHLRLRAAHSWADLPLAGQLNWDALHENSLVHRSGLRVIAAPVMPRPATQPSAELTLGMLSILRQQVAYTIVDLPSVLTPAAQAALQASDMIFHIINPEVVSVQLAVQAVRFLSSGKLADIEKVPILNHVTAEAQLPRSAVEQGLHSPVAMEVGFDPNQGRALAQGVPLVATKAQSPLAKSGRRLAEGLRQRA